MIPKLLHNIWISDKPLPEKFAGYSDTWIKINRGYLLNIIDITNVRMSPFIKEAIDKKLYSLATHYARCEYLYYNGGIYLDCDIEVIKPFDALLNNKLVLGIEDGNSVNNAVILSEAGHPFLKACLDYMDNFDWNTPHIELATGPHMFTKFAREWGWKNNQHGRFKDIAILPPVYFYPYHYDSKFTPDCIKPETFCVHHWAHSWNPMVSIIIPCYKQAHFLNEAIESALAQTYKDIEVIVVNDGSPDNTSTVAKMFPKVKLIEQKNKGLAAARNAGIAASKGGWIVCLDADDKLHENYITFSIRQNDIVSCILETFGNTKSRWTRKNPAPSHKDFLHENQISYSALFKKDIWRMIGGYDETMKLGCEDWDFWIRATGAGFGVTVLDRVLFYYRRHSVSMYDNARKNQDEILNYLRSKHPVNTFYTV